MILWKNVSFVLFIVVVLSFRCNSIYMMLIVGMYFVTSGSPMILCFISVGVEQGRIYNDYPAYLIC